VSERITRTAGPGEAMQRKTPLFEISRKDVKLMLKERT